MSLSLTMRFLACSMAQMQSKKNFNIGLLEPRVLLAEETLCYGNAENAIISVLRASRQSNRSRLIPNIVVVKEEPSR